jgi:class 3 adenylate cyclase
MKRQAPSLAWAGLLLGISWWILESAIHTYVFGSGSILETLLCEHDPNEIWMRILITVLLTAFGFAAERLVRAERHEKDRVFKLNRLFTFIHGISRQIEGTALNKTVHTPQDELSLIEDSLVDGGEIGKVANAVRGLSQHLDRKIVELYALLELTEEINKGVLLDEVLETIYESFQSIIPYNRIGVALLKDNGLVLESRWLRADYDPVKTQIGYSAPMTGSSLQLIIRSGEPRIINDLSVYLAQHPNSASSKLLVDEGIRSSLTCPLIALGKPLGFIFFSSRAPGTYRNVHSEVFKLIAGQLSVVIEKSNTYEQLLAEKEISESLLLNAMPARIIALMKAGRENPVEELPEVGVLFADIVGFTEVARQCTAETVTRFLQDVFSRFDALCDRYGVEKIKTIGDAYMVSTGAPSTNRNNLLNLAKFALEMLATVAQIRYPDGRILSIRIGIHVGPVTAGVIGQKKFAYDMWGDTVNIAHRLQSSGMPGQVHVSEIVYSLLKDDLIFIPRGEIELKGEGILSTYFMMDKVQ